MRRRFQRTRRQPTGTIETLEEVKTRALLDALDKCEGDVGLAAKHLGIGKTTMYRFLDEYTEAARKAGGQEKKAVNEH